MILKKKKYFIVLGILCVSSVAGIIIYKNNLKFGNFPSNVITLKETTTPVTSVIPASPEINTDHAPVSDPVPPQYDINEEDTTSGIQVKNFPFIGSSFPLCSMARNTEIISDNQKLKKTLTYCLEYLVLDYSSGPINSYQMSESYTVLSFSSEIYEVYFNQDPEKNIFSIKREDFITPSCISDNKSKICLPFHSVTIHDINLESKSIHGYGLESFGEVDNPSYSFSFYLPSDFDLGNYKLINLIDESKLQLNPST